MGIIDEIGVGINTAEQFVQANAVSSAVGAAVVGGAIGVGAGALIGSAVAKRSKRRKTGTSRKRGRRITHTKRGWKQDRKRKSKQKWEVAYRKRKRSSRSKSRSKKGIHYTKNGQPYKIMANGRARFVKKR